MCHYRYIENTEYKIFNTKWKKKGNKLDMEDQKRNLYGNYIL